MSTTTYQFITKANQHETNHNSASLYLPKLPQSQILSFYQIAIHQHPLTKLYHIRKFKIDENDNIINLSEYNIKKLHYDKLLTQKKNNEYKLYSVYNLNSVNYPTKSDILLLKSNILSTNNTYTGYAPI